MSRLKQIRDCFLESARQHLFATPLEGFNLDQGEQKVSSPLDSAILSPNRWKTAA